MRKIILVVAFAIVMTSSANVKTVTANKDVNILIDAVPVRLQKTGVWCWAAVMEMLFTAYGKPPLSTAGYQCDIVSLTSIQSETPRCVWNCGLPECVKPAYTWEAMMGYINSWHLRQQVAENIAAQKCVSTAYDFKNCPMPSKNQLGFKMVWVKRAATFKEVVNLISNEIPIIAGVTINPNMASMNRELRRQIKKMRQPGHVVMISGVLRQGNSKKVVVHDPFDFLAYGEFDLYVAFGARKLQRGQYLIDYDTFRDKFAWAYTAHVGELINK